MPLRPSPALVRRSDTVASPCVGVCRMHPDTGWCEGCFRTLDEIAAWGQSDNDWKRDVLAQLPVRRQRVGSAASS